MDNLWVDVGNKCLSLAKAMLDSKTAPTAATVETVQRLVGIAIAIDTLNFRWVQQSQSGAAAFQGRLFSQQVEEN